MDAKSRGNRTFDSLSLRDFGHKKRHAGRVCDVYNITGQYSRKVLKTQQNKTDKMYFIHCCVYNIRF